MQKVTPKKNMTAGSGFLLALVFNVILGVLCYLLLTPHFRNNDDMLIHLITSGAYGEASEYTGFVNVMLSKLLVIMQAAVPAVNWFGVLQFGSVILALSLLEGLMVSQFSRLAGVVLSCGLSFLTLFRLSELHYTATAFILSALGLAALLLALHGERVNAAFAVFGALAAIVGAMLRFNAFFMAAAFVFIPFVLSFFSEAKKLIKVISFITVFVIVFGANIYNNAKYESNPLTVGWLAFCEDRQQISDYALPDYSSRYIEYMQLGISENDFLLLEERLYADREVFPLETMAAVAEIGETATSGQKLWFSLNGFGDVLRQDCVVALALLFAAMLVISGKRSLWLLLAQIAILVAAVVFCLFLGRITPWVVYGAMTAFAAGSAVILLIGGSVTDRSRVRVALSSVLVASVLVLCFVSCNDGPVKDKKSSYYHAVFAEAAEKYPDDLLVCTELGLLHHTMAEVFEGVPADEFKNIYLIGGWDDGLPAKTYALRKKDISSPYRALAERDDVLLMDNGRLGMVINAVYEYCGYGVGFSVIDGIGAFRIVAASEDMGALSRSGDVEVYEAAMFGSYLGEDVTSVCISSNHRLEEGEVAYIRLAEQGSGEGKTYRCKASDVGTDLYEIVVMNFDISAFSEYAAQLIVVSESGESAASEEIAVAKE